MNTRHFKHLICVLTVVASPMVAFIAASAQSAAGSHRIVPLSRMTQDVQVLYGDPDKPNEPFVIRIRELAGGIIPPHRHPVDEHITVVQGTLYFAVGDRFDRAELRELKAGSYVFIPKGSIMFGYTPEAAVVQVHGVGPFRIDWRSRDGWQGDLKTLDSPDAASIFRFVRGERVGTPRGSGRIRQGYDSGEIIGYEIDGDDGSLFMAEECEIRGVEKRKAPNPPVSRTCFSSGFGSKPPAKHARH
jgi:quercetin dioxygenase-like cupin family protein